MSGLSDNSLLLRETLRLWRARDNNVALKDIAELTGLTRQWLGHFDRQRSFAPAVDKVEILYRYLSGKQLDFS